MALWQYTFFVLPKEGFQTLSEGFSFQENNDLFDDSLFWIEHRYKPTLFEKIGNILPKNKSWSENIELYGNEDSNCFEILIEKNIIVSVSFRISFITVYEDILRELIEFFILNGFVIVDEKLNVLKLNFDVIKDVIDKSSQVKKYKSLADKSITDNQQNLIGI